ncbi:MAG: RHS repeat protein [Ruminococcus sp.]|nr:RHS repeat protein [Ruminococcus sp.]
MKKTALVIILAALLWGCGEKPFEPPADPPAQSSIVAEEESSGEASMPEPKELTTEVPKEAVTKKTRTETREDYTGSEILYLDSRGNVVSELLVNSETGQQTPYEVTEYTYDELDRPTYQKKSDSYSVEERWYEYQGESDGFSYEKVMKDGWLYSECWSTYDEFGEYLTFSYKAYTSPDENGQQEIMFTMDKDYTDCDRDENGRVILCREHDSSGEIIETTAYTYDERGNAVVTETTCPGGYHKTDTCEFDSQDRKIHSRQVIVAEEGSEPSVYEEFWEFDDQGRLTLSRKIFGDGTEESAVFTYEEI